ncbi:MAG: hypothetical protein HC913_14850 [Microscillaceae bacterium]|nr:hypothetical protein [Microscillaceae bacterium]
MLKLSLLLACSLWVGYLFAQDLQLKGKVIYAQNGVGVPYCYVQLKDVAIGTVTDYNGTFNLNIPSKYREGLLVFSYVGYQKQFISLSQLTNPQNIYISLVEEVKQLQDIVVKSKREKKLNPKNILKEALAAIPKNYPQSTHHLEAYQRETLRENGAFIKYADAVCKYYSDAYLGTKYAFKDMVQRKFGVTTIVIASNIWASGKWGERLHDHFEDVFMTKFVKDEVKIIASRANENLSTENMQANIEGGAIGIFAKDIIRYIDWFLHKKNFKDYIYEVKEGYDKHLQACYIISFYPRKSPISDEELEEKIKKGKRISREDILAGEIYIDPTTLAFKYIKATVPPEYKKQICNLQKMNIKHFGYDLEIEYTQDPVSKYWYPLKISKQDEFIFADTIKNKVIPYQANSELYFQQLITDSTQVKKLLGEDVYTIENMMPLFDEPVAYYPEFWQEYAQKNPLSIIPDSIRRDLEVSKSLEQQFADRHLRNDSLEAPIAQTKKFQYKIHQETITDDYAWLKDTSALVRYNQEVMDYLKVENEYIENYCKPLRRDQKTLLSKPYQQNPQRNRIFATLFARLLLCKQI